MRQGESSTCTDLAVTNFDSIEGFGCSNVGVLCQDGYWGTLNGTRHTAPQACCRCGGGTTLSPPPAAVPPAPVSIRTDRTGDGIGSDQAVFVDRTWFSTVTFRDGTYAALGFSATSRSRLPGTSAIPPMTQRTVKPSFGRCLTVGQSSRRGCTAMPACSSSGN